MNNSKKLEELLRKNCNEHFFIFSVETFYSAFEGLSDSNLNQLLCRAEKNGLIERVCKGIYVYTRVKYDSSSVLFLAAKLLRPTDFMYLSLESVLSSLSVISQQMLSYITVITSGRSGIINCSRFGKIEFVHSEKMPSETENLRFDKQTEFFWANEELALKDMKKHRRKLSGLISED